MTEGIKEFVFQSGGTQLITTDANGSGTFYTAHAIKGKILAVRAIYGNTTGTGSLSISFSGGLAKEIFRRNDFSGTFYDQPRMLASTSGATQLGNGSGNIWVPFLSNDTLVLNITGGGNAKTISGVSILYI